MSDANWSLSAGQNLARMLQDKKQQFDHPHIPRVQTTKMKLNELTIPQKETLSHRRKERKKKETSLFLFLNS